MMMFNKKKTTKPKEEREHELNAPLGYTCSCGNDTFGVNRPVRGTYYESIKITQSGEIHIEGTHNLSPTGMTPKTMVCEGCGKRQKYFMYND